MKLFSNDPDENPYSLNLSAQAYYPNFIHLETIETFRNSIVEIPVFVDNYESFVGFQFDFHFPDSLDHNSALDNLSSRAQDHILHSSVLTDNSIRVFSFSLTQSEFTGNSGEVVNLSFNTNSIPNGSYNLQFSNAILGDSNSSNILYSSSNGVLVIADSISIVSNIYQPSYMGATDAQIDISVSGGTSPYNITWSTGDNILSIQNLDTGTYSVTVTDFYGKSKISVFEIVDPEYELQEVSLLNGWGLISTYLVPMQNSITVIFSEVEDNLIIMKNETGAVYWPFFGLDMIDSLTLGRGYQVNMSQADTLEIIGYGVEPENTLLNLPLGWSIIGYLKRTEAPANVLLSSIVNDILILKDENGMVYWPYFGLNLIGNMKRGKGYQLSLSSPVQFSFPAD